MRGTREASAHLQEAEEGDLSGVSILGDGDFLGVVEYILDDLLDGGRERGGQRGGARRAGRQFSNCVRSARRRDKLTHRRDTRGRRGWRRGARSRGGGGYATRTHHRVDFSGVVGSGLPRGLPVAVVHPRPESAAPGVGRPDHHFTSGLPPVFDARHAGPLGHRSPSPLAGRAARPPRVFRRGVGVCSAEPWSDWRGRERTDDSTILRLLRRGEPRRRSSNEQFSHRSATGQPVGNFCRENNAGRRLRRNNEETRGRKTRTVEEELS